jgi:hypothetical protein
LPLLLLLLILPFLSQVKSKFGNKSNPIVIGMLPPFHFTFADTDDIDDYDDITDIKYIVKLKNMKKLAKKEPILNCNNNINSIKKWLLNLTNFRNQTRCRSKMVLFIGWRLATDS